MPYHDDPERIQGNIAAVNHRLFKTIVEHAGDYIVVASTDGTILYSGNAFEKLGYERDELLGCNVIDPVHPEDIELARAIFGKMVESDEQQRVDFRMRTSSGEYRWMEGAGIRADGDDEPRVILYARDVTDRKHMEMRVKESEAFMASVIDNSFDLVAVVDMEGTFTFVGDSKKVFGYDRDTVVGTNSFDLIHPDYRDKAARAFSRLVETGDTQVLEFLSSSADGTWRWVEAVGRLFHYNAEKRVLLNIRDITDHKRVEQADKRQIREQSVLLHEVHHRIKNNMNTVASLLSVHAGTIEDPNAVRALEDARSRLHAMHVLYDSLYRSENFERMSIRDYLGRLCDQISEIYPASIPITIDQAIGDFELEVTKLSSLGLITNELLTNAIKHAFHGKPEGHIHVSAEPGAENVLVSVQDNGNGIADDIDPDTHEGFGLSLIRMLSEQLGGSTRVHTSGGTRFEIRFPVEKED